jgi:hypothetical protein
VRLAFITSDGFFWLTWPKRLDEELATLHGGTYVVFLLGEGTEERGEQQAERRRSSMECKASLSRQVIDRLSGGVRLVKKTMIVRESFTDTCTPDGQPGR